MKFMHNDALFVYSINKTVSIINNNNSNNAGMYPTSNPRDLE